VSFAEWAAPSATFHRIRLRGAAGEILWGYRPAASFTNWTIRKGGREIWVLTATIARVEPFAIRQKPLLFSAPREKGFWAWGVDRIEVGDTQIRAFLGPPEQ
jgi:hypothetical protein